MRRGADSLALGSNLRLLNSWTWQLFDFHTSRRCRASFSCAPESQALLLPISFRCSVSYKTAYQSYQCIKLGWYFPRSSPCLLLFLSHLWSEFATSRILFTFQFPKRRDIAADAFTKATQMQQRTTKVMYDRKWWKKYYGWSTFRIDRLWQTQKNMK